MCTICAFLQLWQLPFTVHFIRPLIDIQIYDIYRPPTMSVYSFPAASSPYPVPAPYASPRSETCLNARRQGFDFIWKKWYIHAVNYGVVDVLYMSSLHPWNCHKLGMLNKLMYRTNTPMHSSYTNEIGAANKTSTAKHVNTPTLMQKRTQYGKGSNLIIPVQQCDHLRCLYATLLYGSPPRRFSGAVTFNRFATQQIINIKLTTHHGNGRNI